MAMKTKTEISFFKKIHFIKIILWFFLLLIGIFLSYLLVSVFVYSPQYVYRVLVWQESDAFDWLKFPSHPLKAAKTPYIFETKLDPQIPQIFAAIAQTDNWESYLTENHTQSFIVLKDGVLVYENYFNDTNRGTMLTSFSMAKSFTSALIGIAIQDGYIHSVDEPITNYLPELSDRDKRFSNITIRDLLLMSSGLEYKEMRFPGLNSDDPLTTYYPDQRKLALENTKIIEQPGVTFSYNKYHPQLLGMILERSTGKTVTAYLQETIWSPTGMEHDGSWSIDSLTSDFEKMETGVNARAIDFAKFGQLFLQNGTWQEKNIINPDWIQKSTQPYFPDSSGFYYPEWFVNLPGNAYYTYMWWGIQVEPGIYDYFAGGDKGQFIYISPRSSLVIVRNGIDYGIPFTQWIDIFYNFSIQY